MEVSAAVPIEVPALHTLSPEMTSCEIDDGLPQIGGKGVSIPDVVETARQLHEGFLHDVFCQMPVTGQEIGQFPSLRRMFRE